MWGAESAWRGEYGSDDKDQAAPVSLVVKYSKRRVPLGAWIAQAVTQGRTDGRPWVLVVVGHRDPNPIAVCSHAWLVEVCRAAGTLVPSQEDDSSVSATGSLNDPHTHVERVPGPSATDLARTANLARASDVHPQP
jgi:hypothetical protein